MLERGHLCVVVSYGETKMHSVGDLEMIQLCFKHLDIYGESLLDVFFRNVSANLV